MKSKVFLTAPMPSHNLDEYVDQEDILGMGK
jgi:hypothetical protein